MCECYIHEPWMSMRVFSSECGFSGLDITMAIARITGEMYVRVGSLSRMSEETANRVGK